MATGGARKVSGRVVNAAGQPVAGAQVVLVEPAPAPVDVRFYLNHLYLTDGAVRHENEEVLAHTDASGVFEHQTAADEFGFLVLHMDGFATEPDAGQIELTPWARVTARIVPDAKIQQHLSVTCTIKPSAGLPETYLYMHSPRGDLEHDFIAVPSGLKVSVQRNIEGASGISTSLDGASISVETKPGETVHVVFGPLTKTQRATAEAQLKEWGE